MGVYSSEIYRFRYWKPVMQVEFRVVVVRRVRDMLLSVTSSHDLLRRYPRLSTLVHLCPLLPTLVHV